MRVSAAATVSEPRLNVPNHRRQAQARASCHTWGNRTPSCRSPPDASDTRSRWRAPGSPRSRLAAPHAALRWRARCCNPLLAKQPAELESKLLESCLPSLVCEYRVGAEERPPVGEVPGGRTRAAAPPRSQLLATCVPAWGRPKRRGVTPEITQGTGARRSERFAVLDAASSLVIDEKEAFEDVVPLHQVLARRDLGIFVLAVRGGRRSACSCGAQSRLSSVSTIRARRAVKRAP